MQKVVKSGGKKLDRLIRGAKLAKLAAIQRTEVGFYESGKCPDGTP